MKDIKELPILSFSAVYSAALNANYTNYGKTTDHSCSGNCGDECSGTCEDKCGCDK
jgi:uncharacterized protein with PIN domain